MTTTFMGLTLPQEAVTLGPQWATEINAALTTIDAHDHTVNKGQRIVTAAINLNADLPFNGFGVKDCIYYAHTSVTAVQTGINRSYVKDGDLYFNDGAGNNIRLTAGGALNVGSVGGIGGDYTTTSAAVFYTDATKTYFFQDSTAAAAKMDAGDIACTKVTTPSLVVSTSATIASAAIPNTTGNTAHAGNHTFNGDVTVSGLTASVPVFTDGSKKLVSGTLTGTGATVLATSPTITTPAISGIPTGTLTAGSYTPTIGTPAWPVGVTVSDVLFQYQRIGNIVAVKGTFKTVTDPGSAGVANVTATLPIATSSTSAVGSITRSKNAVIAAQTETLTQGSTTVVQSFTTFSITASSTSYWCFDFSYLIS